MQNEERYKIDKEKSKKYNPNNMFKNQNERIKNETKEETAMVNVKDEKFFAKIIKFLKEIIRKKR